MDKIKPIPPAFPNVALARRRGSFYSSSYSLQLASPFTRVIGSSITWMCKVH